MLVPICLWPSFSQTYKTWKGKLVVSTLSKLLVAAWIKCLLSPLGTKTSARSFNDKPSKIMKPSPLTSKSVRSEAVIEPPYLQTPQKNLHIYAEHGAEVMKRTNLFFLIYSTYDSNRYIQVQSNSIKLQDHDPSWSISIATFTLTTVWHLWTPSLDPFWSVLEQLNFESAAPRISFKKKIDCFFRFFCKIGRCCEFPYISIATPCLFKRSESKSIISRRLRLSSCTKALKPGIARPTMVTCEFQASNFTTLLWRVG